MGIRDVTKEQLTEEIAGLRSRLAAMEALEKERRAELERLGREKARCGALINNIPDVIWTLDYECLTVFISPNAEKVLGYSPEEIYRGGARFWQEKVHVDDHERIKEAYILLFVRGKKYDVEHRFLKKDGNWIWLHARSNAVYKKDGVMYADGLIADVSGRKEAEMREEKTKEGYRALCISAAEGFFCFEAKEPVPVDLEEEEMIRRIYDTARLVDCNDIMARMYGLEKKEDLLGTPLSRFNSPGEKQNVEYIRKFIRDGFRLRDYQTCEFDFRNNRHIFLNNILGIVKNGHLIRAWGAQREVTGETGG